MTSLKTPLAALALMAGLFGGAQAAQAMPVAPLAPAVEQGGPDLLVQAAYGCGQGWHPNRWGRCVPNRWARPVYRPYYRPHVYYRPPVYYVHPWHRPGYGFYGPRWHHRYGY